MTHLFVSCGNQNSAYRNLMLSVDDMIGRCPTPCCSETEFVTALWMDDATEVFFFLGFDIVGLVLSNGSLYSDCSNEFLVSCIYADILSVN